MCIVQSITLWHSTLRTIRLTATAFDPLGSLSTCFSISAIHSSHCFSISLRLSQKWAWVTWKKKSTVRLKTRLFTLDTNLFKTRSRIANLFEHCPLDGGLSDIDVIVTGIFISWRGSAWSLITRLVEVRLRNENQRLDRHKDLKQAWCGWDPYLFRSTVPCVEQRETNFAVNVKVRIETNSVLSSCGQMYFHWRQRIVRWEMDVEFKAAISIRRVTWTRNQNLKISTNIQINKKS